MTDIKEEILKLEKIKDRDELLEAAIEVIESLNDEFEELTENFEQLAENFEQYRIYGGCKDYEDY